MRYNWQTEPRSELSYLRSFPILRSLNNFRHYSKTGMSLDLKAKRPMFNSLISHLEYVKGRSRSYAHRRHKGLEGGRWLTSARIVKVVRWQCGCPSGQHLNQRPIGQLPRGMG